MSSLARCLTLLILCCLLVSPAQAQSTDELDKLSRKLDLLQQSGHYSEALPLVEKLSEAVRGIFGEKSENYAATLARRALVLQALGRYKEAEASFTQAREIVTAALGPEHEHVAFVLNDLALNYKLQGLFREAEPLYQKALAIREKALGQDHPAVAFIVSNLAALYVTQGRYREAETLFTRASAITEKTLRPDDPEIGKNLNNLAMLYWNLGRFSEAEPLFKRAIAIVEGAQGSEHPAVASALTNLAEVYQGQGRYAEAEPLFQRALRIREKAQGLEHAEVGMAANNLAWFYQGWGHLTEAEPLYQRALDITKKTLGPEHATAGSMLNNLAVLYYDQGRYAEAEPLFKRAIDVRQGALGTEHSDVGQSKYRLARLYLAQKRFAEALPLHEQALEIRRKALGPEHPDVIESFNGIAELYEAQGDWPRAADAARSASAIVIKRAHRGTLAANAAALESGRREIALGRAVFLRLARVLWAMREQEPARHSELVTESYLSAQWAEQTEASAALAQMSARQAKGSKDLSKLVRERQDLAGRWQSLDKNLYASIAQSAGRNSEAEQQLRVQLAAIDARIAEIDQTLKDDFKNYSALTSPEPVSVEETKWLLKPDEAMVQFTVGDSETFVWAITRDGERWARSGLGVKALAKHVAALRCGLDYDGSWTGDNVTRCEDLLYRSYTERNHDKGDPLPFDLARAHTLYKALFGDVEDLIKGKQLLIVASGPLTSLPFHVLVTKRPQKAIPAEFAGYRKAAWLGQSSSIGVLPSAASLKALRQYAKASLARNLYLGIGNPLLDGPDEDYKVKAEEARAKQACSSLGAPQRTASTRGGLAPAGFSSVIAEPRAANAALRKWAPLPDTADEVCGIQSKLGAAQSMVLLGSRATEARLKELSETRQLADFSILHFATHGALSRQVEGTSEPGLILTPPPATDDPKSLERDDGYLTASEIATLALDADWVVLSACNTAGPSGETSEALSGLARAFFYAGARALLVSHWEVGSTAAVKLTTRAFAEMAARPSVGRAEALRVAMRELANKGELADAHPAQWAPFVVVGESRR